MSLLGPIHLMERRWLGAAVLLGLKSLELAFLTSSKSTQVSH